MLIRIRLLLFLLLFTTGVVHAQSSEMGIFLGTATYKGEISNSLVNTKSLKPAVGILYRRNLNSHWAYRIGITYGTPNASDADSDDPYQQRRNLSFRSRTFDGHFLWEFNFLPYQIANNRTRFAPFIFGGLSVYRFNPQAELGDDWYNLQPLGTEGQGTTAYPDREKYKRLKVAIPFGGGFKFKLSRRFGMTVEAGARRLFTDYFDDVSTTYADKDILLAENGELSVILSDRSIDGQALNNTNRQRGNASDRDWYMFTGITINYSLSKKYNDNCTPFRGKLR